MALTGHLGPGPGGSGARSRNFQAAASAAADRPTDAALTHDPRHLPADRAFEPRPPRHQCKLPALLDERIFAVSQLHRAAIDSLDGLPRPRLRSEEHTSELTSLMRHPYAVFCL